ncbi:MAG TPA: hypothetical protein VMU14_13210 [Acidimicrobiales bacterium]|nr:hypothetical protein [Acidimicrobiales bacterium]
MRKLSLTSFAILIAAAGCGTTDDLAPSGSEVATSVVSGAVNNSSTATLGWNAPTAPRVSPWQRALDALSPITPAWAAQWSCSGGTLAPTFAGAGTYTFTPLSCSITWRNGKTASSEWSSTFSLVYGASCDETHRWLENQAGGCSLTRTTAAGGNTRTVTGPNGNTSAVTHDTNGAGTGWDSSVSPAPTDAGVEATCASGGCTAGRTIVINGSHITGTLTKAGSSGKTKNWDHTVTGDVTVTGSGVDRVVSGSVTVQHNLAKFTTTTVFTDVGYGQLGCCFPTSGTVTTTHDSGADQGKTESLAFTNVCGEATLTDATGATSSLTLEHCL